MAPQSSSAPITRAGLADTARRRHLDRQAAFLHRTAQRPVQGERPAGERVGPRQPGLAVRNADVEASDEKLPVAHPGRPDGVSDQDGPARHAGHQGCDRGMDVHAVVDHFAGDAGGEGRPDDARLAVVQGPHAVEQVGG